uniref:Uncharacterized protein n=1 Tax=Octopus bimaculoides TaxID=37653 RepID=A0A0L8HEV6_OCTBM
MYTHTLVEGFSFNLGHQYIPVNLYFYYKIIHLPLTALWPSSNSTTTLHIPMYAE